MREKTTTIGLFIGSHKKLYYALNLTWGLLLNVVGFLVAAALMAIGKKPIKYGGGWIFEVGKYWGGFNLGLVSVISKTANDKSRSHEFGHSIQNAMFGIFMPFVVCIPSVIRYWNRRIRSASGHKNETAYDDVWFEGQATELGCEIIGKW